MLRSEQTAMFEFKRQFSRDRHYSWSCPVLKPGESVGGVPQGCQIEKSVLNYKRAGHCPLG